MTESDDLLARFATDGFAMIPQFVVGQKLDELISHVDRFIDDVVPDLPADQAFYEDKHDPKTLKQIQKMGDHDAWFHQLFVAGQCRELAELILKGPVVPKNLQYFNKPPGTSRATPPHQDGYYFMLDPCEAVTMWFAMDNVDEQNGCVRYVLGSHAHGMRVHGRTQTLGFSQGIIDYPTDVDRRGEIAVPAQAGDLLVHDAMTIHRADANRTPNCARRALGFVYYSERAREDTKAHAAYQRQLAEEMRASGKI